MLKRRWKDYFLAGVNQKVNQLIQADDDHSPTLIAAEKFKLLFDSANIYTAADGGIGFVMQNKEIGTIELYFSPLGEMDSPYVDTYPVQPELPLKLPGHPGQGGSSGGFDDK